MCTCEGGTPPPLFSPIEQAIISSVLEECTNALTIYNYTLNSLWKNNNAIFLDYLIPGIEYTNSMLYCVRKLDDVFLSIVI